MSVPGAVSEARREGNKKLGVENPSAQRSLLGQELPHTKSSQAITVAAEQFGIEMDDAEGKFLQYAAQRFHTRQIRHKERRGEEIDIHRGQGMLAVSAA